MSEMVEIPRDEICLDSLLRAYEAIVTAFGPLDGLCDGRWDSIGPILKILTDVAVEMHSKAHPVKQLSFLKRTALDLVGSRASSIYPEISIDAKLRATARELRSLIRSQGSNIELSKRVLVDRSN
jgi:hypothetical protein